jgi:RNA polymerase sigma factor (TIGR02999 family)
MKQLALALSQPGYIGPGAVAFMIADTDFLPSFFFPALVFVLGPAKNAGLAGTCGPAAGILSAVPCLWNVPRVSVPPVSEVTQILSAVEQGDPQAASRLLPLVYAELRQLAAHKLAQEPSGQTLQPTALVHEAYLRLVASPGGESGEPHWDSRGHFFAAAAEAMRRILVENARCKQAAKRGGGRARVDLDMNQVAVPEVREDLLALDEALDQLAAADPEAARLVQLRYFAGLTLAEAAQVLGVAPRTADRLWAYARAWLLQALEGGG